jgi:hypothetical protein
MLCLFLWIYRFILTYNKIVGGVQFKQHRVLEQPCKVGARETQYNRTDLSITRSLISSCYGRYKEKRMSKEPFGTDPSIAGFVYVENPNGETDSGFFANYPAGGFIRNITLTPLTTQDAFTVEMTEMLENGWLDIATRGIIIQFVIYNANFDLNMQVGTQL